jgi:hypothetical protein
MPMKWSAPLFLLMAGILVSGCASQKPASFAPAPGASQMVVTPDTSLAAKVVRYNSVGRYVVLSFPVGQMPKADQRFFLYRVGFKVGEIKIDTWQRDNFVVADLTDGDAQAGDEARDQ